ncbi:thermonuclease family protein [Pedobacter sp. P351]|uniref:thermonuclease family protein n=1 Tax=Pedobacter superstes TaxID=3133441 RepID=UPI0030AE6E49
MKNLVFNLLLLFITSLAISQETITGKVVRIADGDTFTILTEGNKQVKVRFHGIDCPESKQDFGTRAKQFTSELAFSKTVDVQINHIDRYGRTIGVVILPDGKILNEELLKGGLAWHYKHYDKSEKYAVLEDYAKSIRLGVWSIKNQIPPWEFRKAGR